MHETRAFSICLVQRHPVTVIGPREGIGIARIRTFRIRNFRIRNFRIAENIPNDRVRKIRIRTTRDSLGAILPEPEQTFRYAFDGGIGCCVVQA